MLRYGSNGSLFDLIKKHKVFTLNYTRQIIIDILLGLQYLYMNKIIHVDLKPTNILIDGNFGGHLADFGLSLIDKVKK